MPFHRARIPPPVPASSARLQLNLPVNRFADGLLLQCVQSALFCLHSRSTPEYSIFRNIHQKLAQCILRRIQPPAAQSVQISVGVEQTAKVCILFEPPHQKTFPAQLEFPAPEHHV